jgi:hypothetical protein
VPSGERLERVLREIQTTQEHLGRAVEDSLARELARERLGAGESES